MEIGLEKASPHYRVARSTFAARRSQLGVVLLRAIRLTSGVSRFFSISDTCDCEALSRHIRRLNC